MEGENCQQKLYYRTDGPLDGATDVNLECCDIYDDLSGDDKAFVRQKSRNPLPDGPCIPDFWTQGRRATFIKSFLFRFQSGGRGQSC